MMIGGRPIGVAHLERLEPAEELAFKMAAGMLAEDRNPPIRITAELVLTISRLITEEKLDG